MVFRRAFIVATVAIPLLMVVVIGAAIAVAISSQNRSPIGFGHFHLFVMGTIAFGTIGFIYYMFPYVIV